MERQSGYGGSAQSTGGQGSDMQKALLSIRQARDSVLAQNHELISKLAKADEQLAVHASEIEAVECERDVALRRAENYMRECDELRRKLLEVTEEKVLLTKAEAATAGLTQQIATLTEERDALRTRYEEQGKLVEELQAQVATTPPPAEDEQLQAALQDARRKIADLEAQAEGFKAQQKKNIISLTKHLTGDREALRTKFNEEIGALNAQINELQAQLAMAQEASGKADPAPAMHTERLEQQRLEIEELAAQLEATRIQNRELREALDGVRTSPEIPVVAATLPPEAEEALNYDASIALGAMSSCLEMLQEHPGSTELLGELDSHLRGFSERAGAAGFAAIHRYSATAADLTGWLVKTPAKISPVTLAPLGEAFELLGRLARSRNAAQIFDPADALVYAVDDDLDNCECIAMALEKVSITTKYAVRPEVALTEIVGAPCDLIILDVDMPRMDGFELATRIRQVEQHATTPIIFLSGLSSTKDRLEASAITGATYMAKPYNLKELGLVVLGLILKRHTALA